MRRRKRRRRRDWRRSRGRKRRRRTRTPISFYFISFFEKILDFECLKSESPKE